MSKRIPSSPVDPSLTTVIETLYLELVSAYYDKGDREKAKGIISQLETILTDSTEFANSIRGEEIRSIIAEFHENYTDAIQSREAEIRKILELHSRTVNTPNWNYVSQQYDFSDVSDRLDLLAILYDKNGMLDRAIATLLESKEYCQSRQIHFDGQDLLDELDQAQKAQKNRTPTRDISPELLDKTIRRIYKKFKTPADEIVLTDQRSRQFTDAVNLLLPIKLKVSTHDVKRRLLVLRRRGEARGGLPKLKKAD